MDKREDYRELLRRAGQIYVEPVAYDIFAGILPGLVLLLGFIVVKHGLLFTRDFVVAFRSWLLLFVVLVVAWAIGIALLKVARLVRYAKPLQPDGWRKYLWLEAVNDFDDRASLPRRRTAGRLRILADASIAVGAALGILLLVAILKLDAAWAWLILILLVSVVALRILYKVNGLNSVMILAAVATILLLVAIFRLDRVPAWTIFLLLLTPVLLRIVHQRYRTKWHAFLLGIVNQESVTTIGTLAPVYLGPQGTTSMDREYKGSRYLDIRNDLFDECPANRYYTVWGAGGQQALPRYQVTLASVLRGILPLTGDFLFREAARRTVKSRADMRWGPDRRGFRRLLHPNGVCMFGKWEITAESGYTGYFQPGSTGLVIARYSTCCTETRRGRKRSLSMVGKLYPTTDKNHADFLMPASFVTQQDLGGERNEYINEAELRNAPDTTAWRRGFGLPVILLTGIVFKIVDVEPAIRQLYEIAELGKPAKQETDTPEFLRILVDEDQPQIEGDDLDFRDEILAQIYDRGDPKPKRKLVFNIEISDSGQTRGTPFYQRRTIKEWRRIGRIVFEEAVASYNGDFVIHFHHPAWRNDRNNPSGEARP